MLVESVKYGGVNLVRTLFRRPANPGSELRKSIMRKRWDSWIEYSCVLNSAGIERTVDPVSHISLRRSMHYEYPVYM